MNMNANNTNDTITLSRAEYETLLAQHAAMQRQHADLQRQHATMQQQNADLLKAKAKLEHQVDYFMEQLRISVQWQYGKSSEKLDKALDDKLIRLFDEAEAMSGKSEIFEAAEDEPAVTVEKHTRKKRSADLLNKLPENVPAEVVEHKLPAEMLVCSACGGTLQIIGKESRKSLVIIPRQVMVREDVYYTYGCANCSKNAESTPIIKTPKENIVIPGGFASPEAIAHFINEKFVMGTPIYRMEQNLHRDGIMLSRQTMSNWMLGATELWLKPIYEELHRQLIQHDILHADETVLQVLREEDRKAEAQSYMWLYRTSSNADHAITLYEYAPGRAGKYPEAFLEGFKGYLLTDGYEPYHKLNKAIVNVGCWAHLRRKFMDAQKAMPKGKSAGNTAVNTALGFCTKIFKEDKRINTLALEKRYEERQKHLKPLLDDFYAWAKTVNATPKGALGKALTYLEKQWPYLNNVLLDGRLELTNNLAERSIKPFVIGRKNFLFAVSPKGAQSSAIMFSIVETAKENKLNPYNYLCHIFKTAPNLDRTKPDWIKPLLPENAPDWCKAGKY